MQLEQLFLQVHKELAVLTLLHQVLHLLLRLKGFCFHQPSSTICFQELRRHVRRQTTYEMLQLRMTYRIGIDPHMR